MAVTGIGAITPLGLTAAATWDGLVAGRSGVGPITHFDASALSVRIAGEVKGFNPADYMEAKAARRMGRFAQFAIAAARQAVDDAGLTIDDANRDQIGVVMNNGGGGIGELVADQTVMLTKGPRRVSPLTVPVFAPNMASSQVSITLGVRGPVYTGVAACAAGVHAFLQALRLLQHGDAEVVLAGATEAALDPLSVTGFANARALSPNNDDPAGACRPFDRARDGFVMAEGAAVLVLETVEHARRRGARIYALLAGGAATADAYHITDPAPDGTGAALAMTRAMADANLTPADIDFICAHATATPVGDVAEVAAIRAAFGAAAERLVVSAPKSMLGHLMGAAGAAAGLAATLAVHEGVIPPTINLTELDPACAVGCQPTTALRRPVRAALINGVGFGGQNGSVAFVQP
ncbi:MAG: beta-ketoacyl-ACP synthase II [Chloroflexi bacterium]|nr:beta-ketoacyl-ACP synthase II [Chloroflexota bacterium]